MVSTRFIPFRELAAAPAWAVERFVAAGATIATTATTATTGPDVRHLPHGPHLPHINVNVASVALPCPNVPLGTLVTERRELVDPTAPDFADLPYLGLEQIESKTGLLAAPPRRGRELRSRSKLFRKGDLLYGRLRPTLNKVFLADAALAEGICSNEFLVLVPDVMKVDPRWLRFALARAPTQAFVQGRLAGATHPRLAIAELLHCPVPLPPLALQQELGDRLDRGQEELLDLRRRAAALPARIDATIEAMLAAGRRAARRR